MDRVPVVSGLRHAAPRRRLKSRADRQFGIWPTFVLLPAIVVGQLKPAGFTTMGGVDTTVLSVALLLVVTLVVFIRQPSYPLKALLPYFAFALVVLFGVARSELGAYQSLKTRDFFLLTGVIVLCIPVLVRSLRDLRSLVVVWFCSGVLVATVVLTVGGSEDLYGRAGIADATLGPAYVSAAGAVAGAVALGERLLRPWVAIPGMALTGIALISIGSRGPVIAAAAGLVCWVLFRGVLHLRTVLVVAVAAVVISVGVERASNAALSRYVLEDPARVQLWATARAAIVEAPLFGFGWGDFSRLSLVADYPHNLFLEAGAELGLLGLVSLGVLIGLAGIRVWLDRSQGAVRMASSIATVMLVGQLFSADLTNRLFWIAAVPCLLVPLDADRSRTPRGSTLAK